MKILFLNDHEQHGGGAETYMYSLIELLKKKGHSTRLYCSRKSTGLDTFGSVFSIRNMIASYKLIKSFDPDIIHLHKYNLSMSVSPLVSARLLKKKVIVTMHDFGQLCCNSWCVDKKGNRCSHPTGLRWLFKKSISNKPFINKLYDFFKNSIHLFFVRHFTELVAAPSLAMQEEMKAIYKRKDHVLHIPYFIFDRFGYKEKKKITNKLLFIGRLEEEKGLIYALHAISMFGPDIALHIVGSGKIKNELEIKGKDLGVGQQLVFHGRVSNQLLKNYYHQCDAVIYPVIWMEQFGITGIESMSTGTPTIATKIGGIPDWLKDEVNGFLTTSRDQSSIHSAIKKIYRDNITLKKLAKNARETYIQKYSPGAHYKKIIQAYIHLSGR